jgi:transposase-like protein
MDCDYDDNTTWIFVFNCPYCNNQNSIKNGTRHTKNGIKSIRLCKNCGRCFTNQPPTHKKKKNRFETISLAVNIAKDHSLRDTAKILKQKYGINVSYVSVSTWKKEARLKEKPAVKNDGNKINTD